MDTGPDQLLGPDVIMSKPGNDYSVYQLLVCIDLFRVFISNQILQLIIPELDT